MVQVKQSDADVDPITQSFIVDRQAFWTRFTGFTTYAASAIAVLLVLMWYFLA